MLLFGCVTGGSCSQPAPTDAPPVRGCLRCAFVKYKHPEDAAKAIESLNGRPMAGTAENVIVRLGYKRKPGGDDGHGGGGRGGGKKGNQGNQNQLQMMQMAKKKRSPQRGRNRYGA